MAALPTSTAEVIASVNTRRKILATAVSGIIQESGFLNVEKAALGTLVEMMQSLISQIGRESKGYSELAYRTEPIIADIIMALVDLGITMEGLQAYKMRPNRVVITPPAHQVDLKQHNVLQVGDKKSHPSHIPDHLPPFPDTHTYCFSHTYKQPVTEYEAIREKAATQKRDIERALTKFAAKTRETQIFVGVDPNPKCYLGPDATRPSIRRGGRQNMDKEAKTSQDDGESIRKKDRSNESPETELDNPYLRPVKMPRKPKENRAQNLP
nr:transcription initiation factor TFIID subunit 8-like [Penaeus vannamei]